MTEADDERVLDQFRTWLQEARRAAAELGPEADRAAPEPPGFGLERLAGEFTALRHELKLQTRSSRALEERVEASLATLAEAASKFRTASAADSASAATVAEKTLATTLAELDEALERGGEQWKKNGPRLTASPSPAFSTHLDESFAAQSWWMRRLTGAYHRSLGRKIDEAEDKARRDREALLAALLSGYDLIRQRLARAMANAGVARIPTVGKIVDPERMVVIDVVDIDGPAGQVTEEIRRGYTWRGGLLRPAEVRAIRPRFDKPHSVESETSEPEA